MSTLRLVESENIREKLTLEESKKIEKMYRSILKDIEKDVKSIEAMENASSTIKIGYLVDMESIISKKLKEIQKELDISIPSAMYSTSQSVVEDINNFMKSVGLSIKGAYYNLPDDIVRNVISGQLYEKDWSLSKAIWMHTKKAQDDVYSIVAQGIAQNRSVYDIAKDLEKYVNPSAKKPWDWSKMYPGVNKKIDYNAQRLANTMISHAYQQSFVATTKNNPFFTGYKWLTSHSHRGVCEVCRERAETDQFGLGEGVFPKDQLPLDHPNGVCTYAIILAKDMSDIADDIANWYNGVGDPKMNEALDKYVNSLR